MGFFSAIKAGAKAIFGVGDKGSDNVMTVAKGIGGWIDEQQFTDQEQAQFNGEMVNQFGRFMQATVDENSERSITRRVIAIWVIRFEIFLLAFSLLAYKIDVSWSKFAFQLATTSPMSYLVLGIGGFFFGAHILRSMPGKNK